MSNKIREIALIPFTPAPSATTPHNAVQIQVEYEEGGTYLGLGTQPRGLYLVVRPVVLKGDFISTRSGIPILTHIITEMGRFSKKKLEQTQPDAELLKQMLNKTCENLGIEPLELPKVA